MAGAQTRLDTAAENLANGSSDGFRRARLHGSLRPGGIVFAQERDGSQGALRATGRDFDLAIVGPGAFSVRAADGSAERTRDGRFMRDRLGRLCDVRGRFLLGTRGALTVPQGASIDAQGRVTANGTVLDRIALPPGASVRSGFLESSNVDAIAEMVDILTAQRSYETAQKVLAAIDQTRDRASSQVALVKS